MKKLEYTLKWIHDIQLAIKEQKIAIEDTTPLEAYGDLIRAIVAVSQGKPASVSCFATIPLFDHATLIKKRFPNQFFDSIVSIEDQLNAKVTKEKSELEALLTIFDTMTMQTSKEKSEPETLFVVSDTVAIQTSKEKSELEALLLVFDTVNIQTSKEKSEMETLLSVSDSADAILF